MQYVLVVKHIEGITNVTLCAICTCCENVEGITNVTFPAIYTGCETHRGNNKCYIMCT